MYSRTWVIFCVFRATGKFTSTPRCSMGAATMKMMRSTSITSTRGMTLISERVVETRRPRRPRPTTSGIGITFGMAIIVAAGPGAPYVKFLSAMLRNSSAKSSISDAYVFTLVVKWL